MKLIDGASALSYTSPKQYEAKRLAEVVGGLPDMAFGRVAEAVKRMERVGALEAGLRESKSEPLAQIPGSR